MDDPMVLELEVRLMDAPGKLIEMLEPLSQYGANIQGVFHMHGEVQNNLIPVLVTFTLPELHFDSNLNKIKKALLAKGIEIVRLSAEQAFTSSFLALGHVFQTDFVDTIRRLSKPGIRVISIEARFKAINDPSAVLFSIQLENKKKETELLKLIDEISKEKDLVIIKG
jgi:ACT domain-containing protein